MTHEHDINLQEQWCFPITHTQSHQRDLVIWRVPDRGALWAWYPGTGATFIARRTTGIRSILTADCCLLSSYGKQP